MTEKQFRELLLSFDEKFRVKKMGTSGDVWVAMGELVNGATQEEISGELSTQPLEADVTGEDGTVWIKVKDAPEKTSTEKPLIVIPPLNIGLFLATVVTTLMAGTIMEGGNPFSLSDISM